MRKTKAAYFKKQEELQFFRRNFHKMEIQIRDIHDSLTLQLIVLALNFKKISAPIDGGIQIFSEKNQIFNVQGHESLNSIFLNTGNKVKSFLVRIKGFFHGNNIPESQPNFINNSVASENNLSGISIDDIKYEPVLALLNEFLKRKTTLGLLREFENQFSRIVNATHTEETAAFKLKIKQKKEKKI